MNKKGRQIVYVVIEGASSEFSVVGAFCDKAAAEQCAEERQEESCYLGEARVEQCHLNSGDLAHRRCHVVNVDMDGEETARYEYSRYLSHPDDPELIEVWQIEDKGELRGVGAQSYRGHGVALKAARDKLAEVKARGARAV